MCCCLFANLKNKHVFFIIEVTELSHTVGLSWFTCLLKQSCSSSSINHFVCSCTEKWQHIRIIFSRVPRWEQLFVVLLLSRSFWWPWVSTPHSLGLQSCSRRENVSCRVVVGLYHFALFSLCLFNSPLLHVCLVLFWLTFLLILSSYSKINLHKAYTNNALHDFFCQAYFSLSHQMRNISGNKLCSIFVLCALFKFLFLVHFCFCAVVNTILQFLHIRCEICGRFESRFDNGFNIVWFRKQ